MKQLTKIFLIAGLLFTSAAVMASGNLKVSIVQGAADEAIVKINNAVNSLYKIEVQNANGDIVFYKETNYPSKNYSNVYDFSRLSDGIYSFKVDINKETSISRLKVSHGKVKLVEQKKEVEPFFAMKNDRLEITYLNFDRDDIKLYVYEQGSNRPLHEEDLGSGFALNHALDFSKLEAGYYDAILVSNHAVHEYNIKVD